MASVRNWSARAASGNATVELTVALEAYQEIFCRMIASADYRTRLIEHPQSIYQDHVLTEREQRRLSALAAHPGMRVNMAIHRANRLTPLDQTLPFTCFLIGDRLGPLLDRYWDANPTENLQLPAECARFADFLEQEINAGLLLDPYLAEVLAFERVCTELRFFSEQELVRKMGTHARLPAQVRILRFRHDPEQLLDALSELKPPPARLEEGEFYLAIDARSGDSVFRVLDGETAVALTAL
jgi:hypothetical protein